LSKAHRSRGGSSEAVEVRSPGGADRAQSRIGRPPKGKTLLSLQRLLKEARTIVDDQGLEALSMRALAERLGVTAMSLYRYCESHEALLDAVHDEILAAYPPRPVTREQSWREVLTEMARALRRAFAAHPNAAMLLATRPVRSPSSSVHIDAVIGRLVESGFDLSIAVNLIDSVSAFTVGHCLAAFGQLGAATSRSETQLGAARSRSETQRSAATSRSETQRSAAESPPEAEPYLPYLSQVTTTRAATDFDAEFVVGLVAILDGFANRYAKRQR
jgi:AcrR family transcriptional regulator